MPTTKMELFTSRRVNFTMLNAVMLSSAILSMKNRGESLVTLPSFSL